MSRLQIMDTTIRDGQQSLWATRMQIGDMLPILSKMDRVGYWAIEAWGGATFDTCLRFLDENPWERLRAIKKHCPRTPLSMLVRGQVGLNEMSGPVGIVDAIGETYQESRPDGWFYVAMNLLMMAILLSVNLGVMNLLPIPALDGGRLVFLIIEAIRGKALPTEKESMVHFLGFVFLMGLMVLILFNDVYKIFLR